jgi:hypothetical protein
MADLSLNSTQRNEAADGLWSRPSIRRLTRCRKDSEKTWEAPE